MTNSELVHFLNLTSKFLNYKAEDRNLAYEFQKIARHISEAKFPLQILGDRLREAEAELRRFCHVNCYDVHPGVVLDFIHLLRTGHFELYGELKQSIPESIQEILNLKSVLPEQVSLLEERLRITNISDLKKACEQHQLSQIEGFSDTAEVAILTEIRNIDKTGRVLYWANAEYLVNWLKQMIVTEINQSTGKTPKKRKVSALLPERYQKKRNGFLQSEVFRKVKSFFQRSPEQMNAAMRGMDFPPGMANDQDSEQNQLIFQMEVVGDFRRCHESIAELEFLIETDNPEIVLERIQTLPVFQEVYERFGNSLVVKLSTSGITLPCATQSSFDLPVHFYTVPRFSFGAGLVYFTAEPAHWQKLSVRANQEGYYLNEFGIYRHGERLSSRTEARVYRRLGLPLIPPELRCDRREWEWVDKGAPALIDVSDLRGDLHMHTTYTDGVNTIDEMVRNGIEHQLEYIALTDHTKNVVSVGGLLPSEALLYWKQIDETNQVLAKNQINFYVLKGIEVDILDDGTLDYDDDILAQADWVVASIHFGLDQSSEQINHRYHKALKNRYVHAIAHPTNRIIEGRGEIQVDIDFLCTEAARNGKFLEINSQPRRVDLNDIYCAKAHDYGVPLVISTDSHAAQHMDYLRFGVNQARRAGLTANDILNTCSLTDLLERIKR